MNTYMSTLHQMLLNFSEWLYTMWIVNIVVGIYACYVIYQYSSFIKQRIHSFWEIKITTSRLVQAFSWILVAVMFLWADMWAMLYYTTHALSPLEFFYYAFDAAVMRHLSDEARRFNETN